MGRVLFGYTVVNLGCKVNRVEADGFERLLAERGGVPVGEAAADLIVVNTCTVTGEAEKKTRKAVRHALSTNDGARVVVTGCASELSSETFAAMDDRVVVVPKAGADLYLSELEMSGTAPCETPESFPASPADGRTRIGIKVQDGCDNACTYCIVHVARGRATSRPADEVVAEAVALAESGVREVVLTGINLGSYDDGGTDLTDLCRRLLTATADLHGAGEPPCRFRIGSIEPMDVTGEFVSLLAEAEGRICRHLHLPLQSGSSRVLREMARPYDAHEFRQLADFLRASVPSIALTTDIIVGFPGETDEDFEELREFVEETKFDRLGVFAYSREEDTPAYDMPDQVDEEVKEERRDLIMLIQSGISEELNEAKRGSVQRVLVEDKDEIIKSYYGRTYADSTEVDGKVFFKSDKRVKPGDFVNVRIDSNLEYDLFGVMIDK